MEVFCIGLNHQTAPVETRERLAVRASQEADVSNSLLALPGIDGVVLLSTCNRVEFYLSGQNPSEAARQWIEKHFGLSPEDAKHLYELGGRDVWRHLFSVVAGIDSMVLGETEIFGQVKSAYAAAHARGATRTALNRMFQRAFAVGKRLRNHTAIQRGATSVGSVAVELAERIFGDLRDCHVMLLGAGEMSRVTAQSLLSRGARSIIVSNRSYDRAVELATAMGGEALRFDDWPSRVAAADIVIASTGAPHFVVTHEQIEQVRRRRRSRPLFMIDIAVPRNVDPAIHTIDDVYLYDIDALQSLADEGRKQREEQVGLCRAMIEEELAKQFSASQSPSRAPSPTPPRPSTSSSSQENHPNHA